MPINRREFVAAGAALATTVIATGLLPPFARQAWAADEKYSAADLSKSVGLPDMVLGKDTAPVTVIEYASMTCPHCAHFSDDVFPQIKKNYIDTGKVRWILREFPLDSLAAAAFMLARCSATDKDPITGDKDPVKYYAMVDTLFSKQPEWAVRKPIPPLRAITKQAGMTDKEFDACLANQKLLNGIEKVRQNALDKFKVDSTPTFFVNGSKHAGALPYPDMAKIIDGYLKAG